MLLPHGFLVCFAIIAYAGEDVHNHFLPILLRLAAFFCGTDALEKTGALRQHTPCFIRRRRRFGGAASRPLDVPPGACGPAPRGGSMRIAAASQVSRCGLPHSEHLMLTAPSADMAGKIMFKWGSGGLPPGSDNGRVGGNKNDRAGPARITEFGNSGCLI